MKERITIFCRGEEDGGVERKSARNFLVIPKAKRVYLILPDGMATQQVLWLCREILSKEEEEPIVYVFVERGDALSDRLREEFRGQWAIQPIVIGSKATQFGYAADVILTRAGILSTAGLPGAEDLGKWRILRSGNFREVILNVTEILKSMTKQEERI